MNTWKDTEFEIKDESFWDEEDEEDIINCMQDDDECVNNFVDCEMCKFSDYWLNYFGDETTQLQF